MSDADTPETLEVVSPEDLRVLLRMAGLDVSAERVPSVLAELNSQLAVAKSFDEVLEHVPAESDLAAPFDPAWIAVTTQDGDK